MSTSYAPASSSWGAGFLPTNTASGNTGLNSNAINSLLNSMNSGVGSSDQDSEEAIIQSEAGIEDPQDIPGFGSSVSGYNTNSGLVIFAGQSGTVNSNQGSLGSSLGNAGSSLAGYSALEGTELGETAAAQVADEGTEVPEPGITQAVADLGQELTQTEQVAQQNNQSLINSTVSGLEGYSTTTITGLENYATNWAIRIAVIVLGLIFVGVGLFMFKPVQNVVVNAAKVTA